MIVVKIQGGLGNQMFQYATARALAHKLNSDVKLDISSFRNKESNEKFTYRKFDLSGFNISANTISQPFDKPGMITRLLGTRKSYTFYYEKDLRYNPDLFNLSGNIYLEGYFQSEKYFKSIRSILLSELTLKESNSRMYIDFKKMIASGNSVAVHIRRGDYVNKSFINFVHGVCGVEYYRSAFQKMNGLMKECTFYFFSDDLPWVMENLSNGINAVPVHIDEPNAHFYEMMLMSVCKANIIANSTFSWWGAWLNDRPEKTVIAPQKWFADPYKNQFISDLIPKEWIRL